MTNPHPLPRRQFLNRASHAGALAAAAIAMPLLPPPARAASGSEKALSLRHAHTGERLSITYAADGRYRPEALLALDHLLRDHYSGAVGRIDPPLFDLLHALQRAFGQRAEFEVISGYRSADTNERLRRRGGGGVARSSLHCQGQAVDVRLAGVAPGALRDAALALRGGGVGLYAREGFVHLDTGRVRAW